MPPKGKNGPGNSTSGMEYSPARRRRRKGYLKRQEAAWAAKAGPVTVRYVDPKPSSKSTEDGDAV